jgi:AraC-like DNA-binding protein
MMQRRSTMHFKINTCGICDCLPEWKWETNGFPDYDLWAVFRGDGVIRPATDDQEPFFVHDGACLLLTPNTPYIAKHDPDNPLLVINVHFDFLDDEGKRIYPEHLQKRILAYPNFLKELLMRVVTFYNANDEKTAEIYFSAAFSEFVHADTQEESDAFGIWNKIVSEICSEVDRKPQTPSLSHFSKKYGYTERYIGKMFSQIKKISYSDYSQNSRINKAKTMLRQTSEPISVISETLGFYDSCHFTKSFLKFVGTSPRDYRKQICQNISKKTENL